MLVLFSDHCCTWRRLLAGRPKRASEHSSCVILRPFPDRCCACLKIALGAPPRRAAEQGLRTLILCNSEAISGPLPRLPENRSGRLPAGRPKRASEHSSCASLRPFLDRCCACLKSPWGRLQGPGRRNVCISRVWRISTAQNPFVIVVWVAQRAYFMRLEVSAAQSPYNNRGLGGTMCVFHVFGGYRPPRTPIIEVWDT